MFLKRRCGAQKLSEFQNQVKPTVQIPCARNKTTDTNKNEDAHRILTPGRLPWLRIIAVHSEPRPGKLILTHSPHPANGVSLVEAPARARFELVTQGTQNTRGSASTTQTIQSIGSIGFAEDTGSNTQYINHTIIFFTENFVIFLTSEFLG